MTIDALILAAGQSTRMGSNKLLEPLGDHPLLRYCVNATLASNVDSTYIVIGHQDDVIRNLLNDVPVNFVHNPNFASGLSTSLKAGIAALPSRCDAVIILLGDMPFIDPQVINILIDTFSNSPNICAVVPTFQGSWGNPVLIARRLFHAISDLEGDMGARKLLMSHHHDVIEVPVATDSVTIDLDTPETLAKFRARAPSASPY